MRDIIARLSPAPAPSKCTFQGAGLGISMATAKRPGTEGGRWWAVGTEAGMRERGGGLAVIGMMLMCGWKGVQWSQRGMLGTETKEHCDIFMCHDNAD